MVEFAVPKSVECTCNLDDSAMLRELGLTYLREDARGRRVFSGATRALINVIDTCLAMAADHADEDPAAKNAAVWARREGRRLVEKQAARWSAFGGIEP